MSLNLHDDDRDVETVATEIAKYLKQRAHVADTIEGIAQWWLMRQRLWEERQKVEMAVEYLCKQGVIHKRVMKDGSVLYIAAEEKDK